MQSLGLWPVALEHAQANRILLHLEDGLDARAVEAKVEAPDAAEQRDSPHHP